MRLADANLLKLCAEDDSPSGSSVLIDLSILTVEISLLLLILSLRVRSSTLRRRRGTTERNLRSDTRVVIPTLSRSSRPRESRFIIRRAGEIDLLKPVASRLRA